MQKDFLHECFICDPVQGTLTWKERPRSHFDCDKGWRIFNRKFAGKGAGSKSHIRGGMKKICMMQINGTSLFFGRVMWVMNKGPIPDGIQIDHINGDPWDNRLSNLRTATNQQNCMNRSLRRNSKSGYKGASWYPRRQMWCAQIYTKGKNKYLGLYATPEEAHAAYCKAAKELHGEFARTS